MMHHVVHKVKAQLCMNLTKDDKPITMFATDVTMSIVYLESPDAITCFDAADDLSKPELALKSNYPICYLSYSTKDTSVLAGGQFNGQVAVWDVRRGSRPVERSEQQHSLTDPAYQTVWLQSKSGTEFFSTSTDGQVSQCTQRSRL